MTGLNFDRPVFGHVLLLNGVWRLIVIGVPVGGFPALCLFLAYLVTRP